MFEFLFGPEEEDEEEDTKVGDIVYDPLADEELGLVVDKEGDVTIVIGL